ncbi:MAG TPA: cyclic nucleotide-binding domain-containing protein [Spirochaetia bacterium]|nr:cyclic nucleotide-binding domain-containing protein [Spirochaetia bacterium]
MRKAFHAIPVFRWDGTAKVFYNAVLIFAALTGTIITSYRLTFQEYQTDWLYWLITVIYIADIPYCFNQSVKKGLRVYADRRSIARMYLRGWFTLDVIACIPFAWLFSFIPGATAHSGAVTHAGLALDIIVISKVLKMAKISKVSAIFREIRESLSINPSLMRLVTFAFWFVTAVHLMACGWIIIGASEPERPHLDQYIRGVYWCVTTIATIGYGDYTPSHSSNLQIIYTVGVMVFGVGMYGFIIGNVATLIANLDVARAAYQDKMEEINDFFRTKRVPSVLQSRVRNYYAYMWETQKSVSPVSLTEELPHTLAMEVLLFLNRAILEKVSLFKNANEIFIREIVQLLRPLVFLPDDYIIRQGEYGDRMYFLSSGEVEVLVGDTIVARLGDGSPFGETALLQGEKRTASIRAVSFCDVYMLAKADFDALRIRYPEFDAQVKKVVEDRLRDTQEKTQK